MHRTLRATVPLALAISLALSLAAPLRAEGGSADGSDDFGTEGIRKLLAYASCAVALYAARGELSLAAAMGSCIRLYAEEVR